MNISKIGYNIGTLLSIESALRFAKAADKKNNVDSLWIPESWGREAFVTLGALSQVTKKLKLGTAIISIHSRTPATVAMAVSTLDILSNNRTILGLGVSTPILAQNWHGVNFDNPFEKLREYIDCIRQIMKGSKVDFEGKYYKIRGFKIFFQPQRNIFPIYTAAVNKIMIDLSCEIADGMLLYLRPMEELQHTVEQIKKQTSKVKKRFEICCSFITALSNKNPERARIRAAKTLAFYVAVGKYYNRFLLKNGYETEVQNITEEYQKNGFNNIHNFVSDKMLNSLTIYGTSEDCIKSMKKFLSSGISLPIVQINPVDHSEGSIMELLSTFSN